MADNQDVDSLIAAVQRALDAEDLAGAWTALEPAHGRLAEDRRVAGAWLTLLRLSPGRPGLLADIKLIGQAFPHDPELVTSACDALTREAERLAPDTPPPEHGCAHTLVTLAQRCLEKLSEAQRADGELMGYLQMNLANGLRMTHLYERAERAYKAALKRGPERGWWWFNFGLLHKASGAYAEGLSANERALSLLGPQKPVLWNIAICATAVGDGARAQEAYRGLGIPVEVAPSGMPQAELPPVQVRVATVGPGHAGPAPVPDQAVAFELLWVQPLSPCHGVVTSPTYRQADVDYGDVILWDAVPVGTDQVDGKQVPRFAVLSVLHKGDEHRLRFVGLERAAGAIQPLVGELTQGGQLFVHREPGQPDSELVYGKVVLPADADLQAFQRDFDSRLKALPNVELVMPGLWEALGDSPAAGKAHTMWRGLERTVEKRQAVAGGKASEGSN